MSAQTSSIAMPMLTIRHIRKGGRYLTMGRLALLPAILGAVAASKWHPGWSTIAYYATCTPSSLGYSVFLCVQLVGLVGAVDSAMMVSLPDVD